MSTMKIEVCPETGICSLIREGSGKVDLMPDEAAAIAGAKGNAAAIRAVIGEVNESFAEAMSDEDIAQLAARLA